MAMECAFLQFSTVALFPDYNIFMTKDISAKRILKAGKKE